MDDGARGDFQGADPREIRNGGVALLCDSPPVGRWRGDASGDPARPFARVLGGAEPPEKPTRFGVFRM